MSGLPLITTRSSEKCHSRKSQALFDYHVGPLRSDCVTVIPGASAAFRLITILNLVGSITSSSAGFSPLRMRPAQMRA